MRQMLKQLMKMTQAQQMEQKQEKKAQDLVIVNLKQQSDALKAQQERVAAALGSASKGGSTLSSLGSI